MNQERGAHFEGNLHCWRSTFPLLRQVESFSTPPLQISNWLEFQIPTDKSTQEKADWFSSRVAWQPISSSF